MGIESNNDLICELANFINYDSEKGAFSWNCDIAYNVKKGTIAGHLGKKGYWIITFRARPLKAHRLAWLKIWGAPIPNVLDHINGDRNDNRILNIRASDTVLNGGNRREHREGGLLGTTYLKRDGVWVAQGWHRKKKYFFGRFPTKEQASEVYKIEIKKIREKK